MTAAALRRTAKSPPGGSTNQSWSPNSGSATTDELSNQSWTSNSGETSEGHAEPGNDARFRVRAADATCQQPLGPQRSDGPQHQSATSPLDQPHGAPVQYQPSGNDPSPLATETGSQYQPIGNGTSGTTPAQYLSSGEGHTSRNIAKAQLTQLISPDDDAEMPAAPLVHDITTPRRQVGGRCRKWAVNTQQTTDKRKMCCLLHVWSAIQPW